MWNWELKSYKNCTDYCECMHVHRIFSYSHVQNILQPHRQSMKLRSMIVNIKTKVLFKFGNLEMMCEELRAKKLWKLYLGYCECVYTHGKFLEYTCRVSHQCHVHCLHHSRLWIQTQEQRYWSDFGACKVWGVQLRPKKLQDMYSID